jgi:hypothetical protein
MTSTTAGVSVKRRRRRRLTVDDQLLISVGVRAFVNCAAILLTATAS